MKPTRVLSTMLGVCLPLLQAVFPVHAQPGKPVTTPGMVTLPLSFQPAATPGHYLARGGKLAVAIAPTQLDLATRAGVCHLRWLGAAPAVRLLAEQPTTGLVHELLGNDPATHRRNLPLYAQLRADQLYPGVNAIYYGNPALLEFDLHLAPAADPEQIRFALPGARLEAGGALHLSNGLVWQAPVAYQLVDGQRRTIPAAYRQKEPGRFSFALGEYDRTRPLVIDPVLSAATYFGGALADEVRAVALDPAGNIYVTGATLSSDLPGTNRGQTFGAQDVFVAKLNPTASAILYSTYLGGAGTEQANAIHVGSEGEVTIAGATASTNFPVSAGAPQPRFAGGGSALNDAFVLRLNAAGSALVWSSYLGGPQAEVALGLTVDRERNTYVTGRTDSTDFPNTSPNLPARGAGDAFVTKINLAGTAFVYSTVLGGFGLDYGTGVAVDATGAVYVTGETRSSNFPVTEGVYQAERRGNSDAFVTKLQPDGASLVWSSYFGGGNSEVSNAVVVDGANAVYIGGQTTSSDLPLGFSAFQRASALAPDAFVAKFNRDMNGLLFSTYLGGDGEDTVRALALSPINELYAAGITTSVNFPTRNDGPLRFFEYAGGVDGFLTKFNQGANTLQFSTYLGGAGTDNLAALATDGQGRLLVAGTTDSPQFLNSVAAGGDTPVSSRLNGPTDGFVMRLNEINVIVTPALVTLGPGETQQFAALVTNTSNTGVRWTVFPSIGTISETGLYRAPADFVGTQRVTITAVSLADGTKSGEATITLEQRLQISLTPSSASLTVGGRQQFTAVVTGGTNRGVSWSLSPSTGTISDTGLYTAPAFLVATATVIVRATSLADPARSATATVTIQPAGGAPAPVISLGGITNSASFQAVAAATPGGRPGIAPGQIITLFGTNLGPATASGLQVGADGKVTSNLLGSRLLVDNIAAPMIATSAGQISAVVPFGIEGKPEVQVIAEFEGRRSTAVAVPVAETAPGIYTANTSGSGPGAILNQDFRLNSITNPAPRGSVVIIYCTGLGATQPASEDGRPNAAPFPAPKAEVKVTIGSLDAQIEFVGGAPGLVAGVYQLNVRVPATASIGEVPIQITAGGRNSQPNVTLFVRQ